MKTALAAFAAFVAVQAAQAAPSAHAPWTRPAAQGATGVGFMTLMNPGARPDVLIAVETPAARQATIHQSSVSGGVATMRALASVPIPAGGRVTFEPAGRHIMFLGLNRALRVGDALPATLVFASGAKVKVAFVVRMAPPADGHAHP